MLKQEQNGGKYKENTNWLKSDENLNKFKLKIAMELKKKI